MAIDRILDRTLGAEFYRMHSGTLLVMATLTLGFMSSAEHIALGQYFISGWIASFIPIGVWCSYSVAILRFNGQQVIRPENRFLSDLQFLPRWRQFRHSLLLFSIQFLPAIAYCTFLCVLATRESASERIILLAGALFLLVGAGAYVLTRQFRGSWHDQTPSKASRIIDRLYPRPHVQFYVEWLLRTDPVGIAATKLATGLLLAGVCALYRYEEYDGRLLAMAITACGLANVLLAFRLLRFEHVQMCWTKNLPIGIGKRYTTILAALCIFLIPEVVVVIRNFPGHLGNLDLGIMVGYLTSIMALLIGTLQVKVAPVEYFTAVAFWLFLGFVVLILFEVPIMLLAALCIIGGVVLFRATYYKLELPE